MPLGRVLRTRLMPPRLPAGCLPRPALVARVREGLAGRLVLACAGAGYGKSTLLAQAVEGLEGPWAWVSVDERIAEPAPLLAHLAAALGERYPGFGAALSFEGPPERQVRELCNEVLSTVSDDLVVVLDDVHVLREPSGAETLDLLVHDLPPNVHLALAARTEPALALARLRPQGVLELSERDLALGEDEALELLGQVAPGLSPAERERMAHASEGWVTGLLLTARPGAEAPADPGPAGGHSLGYLADEVLAALPEDVQDFLIRTAVLERFTPAMAATVSGREDAAAIIDALLAEHVFAVRLDAEGGWIRYHNLFQSLLRRRLRDWPPERAAALRRLAGDAWRAAGDPGEAVRNYVAAGDLAAAVDVLEPVAVRMIEDPEGQGLSAWLEAIPPELWSDSPGLVLARASALFARARFGEAFTALERALDALLAAGDRDRAAVALFRYLRALSIVGGLQDRAVRAGERWLPGLDPQHPMVAASRVLLATAYAESCRVEQAEDELRAAGYLAAAGGLPVLTAYAQATWAFTLDHPLARDTDALAAIDDAIAQLELNAELDDMNFLPFARAYRAVVLNDQGRFDEALAEAARVREAAAERDLGPLALPIVAWMRFEALAGLGRWAELGAELAWSATVFDRIAGAARGYRYHVAAARLAAATGGTAAVGRHSDSAPAGLRAQGGPGRGRDRAWPPRPGPRPRSAPGPSRPREGVRPPGPEAHRCPARGALCAVARYARPAAWRAQSAPRRVRQRALVAPGRALPRGHHPRCPERHLRPQPPLR